MRHLVCLKCDEPKPNLSANGFCGACFDKQDTIQQAVATTRRCFERYRSALTTNSPDSDTLAREYALAVDALMIQTGWSVEKANDIVFGKVV